jgi:hypothetical protein
MQWGGEYGEADLDTHQQSYRQLRPLGSMGRPARPQGLHRHLHPMHRHLGLLHLCHPKLGCCFRAAQNTHQAPQRLVTFA